MEVSHSHRPGEEATLEDSTSGFQANLLTTAERPGSTILESQRWSFVCLPRTSKSDEGLKAEGETPKSCNWAPTYTDFIRHVEEQLRTEGSKDTISGAVWQVGRYCVRNHLDSAEESSAWIDMSSEDAWHAAICDHPWGCLGKVEHLMKKICTRLRFYTSYADVQPHLKQMATCLHGLWELSCCTENLQFFQPETLELVVKSLSLSAPSSELAHAHETLMEYAAGTMWALAARSNPLQDFQQALIKLGACEVLADALSAVIRGAPHKQLSMDTARLLKSATGALGVLLKVPQGCKRLAVGNSLSLQALMEVSTVISPKHLSVPHAEELAIAAIRCVLLSCNVDEERASFIGRGGVRSMLGILEMEAITLRANMCALLASVCEYNGWGFVATDGGRGGVAGAFFSILVKTVDCVTLGAKRACEYECDGQREGATLPEETDLPCKDILKLAWQHQELMYNDAFSWLQTGRGLWGAAKAIHVQQPPVKLSAHLLKHLVSASRNIFEFYPARHAAAGAGGAIGLISVQRAHARILVEMDVLSLILDLMKLKELDAKLQSLAACGIIAWHPKAADNYEPPATLLIGQGTPLVGEHRDRLCKAGAVQRILQVMAQEVDADATLSRAKMAFGELEEAFEKEISQLCSSGTKLLLRCGAATLMMLFTTGAVQKPCDIHELLRLTTKSIAVPQALQHLAASVWCLSRNAENHSYLLEANAVTRILQAVEEAWCRVESYTHLREVESYDETRHMSIEEYSALVHAIEWLLAAVYVLVNEHSCDKIDMNLNIPSSQANDRQSLYDVNERALHVFLRMLEYIVSSSCSPEVANSKIQSLLPCIMLTLVMQKRSVGNFLLNHGLLNYLHKITENESSQVPARVRATQLHQLLAASPEGKQIVGAHQLAQMLVWLLRSHVVQLQEVGARGAAIHALDHKAELAQVGALDLLVARAKNPATSAILECCIKALHNLSSHKENQVNLCKKALYFLFRLNQHPDAMPDMKACTSAILQNLSSHPANRTRMYKAELRIKSGKIQGLERFAEVGN